MATDDPGLAGSSTRLMPNSTSWAVSGTPSDQCSPSRRWNTYRRPSSLISHRSASDGTMVRSGHVQRVVQPGPVPGLREVRDGLVLVGRGQPVPGQEPGHLGLIAGVVRLEPFRGPAV